MNTQQINYTVINHIGRIKLGLSLSEYVLADYIYNLQYNKRSKRIGWCYASKQTMADMMGMSDRGTRKILGRLTTMGLIEVGEDKRLTRTTSKWYENVVTSSKVEVGTKFLGKNPKGGNKVPEGGNKVPTTIITDNKRKKEYKNILPKENKKNPTSIKDETTEPIPPSPIRKNIRTQSAELLVLFQEATKQPRVRMTDGRKDKLKARLEEFSLDEIKKAITNASKDSWWMSDGKRYLTLDYLLRNNETLDRLLNLKPKKHGKQKRRKFFKRV